MSEEQPQVEVEEPAAEQKDQPDELALAKDEVAKLKDQLLRTAADFDNYRKRQRREMDDVKKYAAEKVLLEMLPVLDNMERALNADKSDKDTLMKGLKMVADQFRTVLDNQGAKPFESVGQMFDPTKHEAISEREDDKAKPGTVLEEFQRGYMLGDRVVRPAMVVVAKAASTPLN